MSTTISASFDEGFPNWPAHIYSGSSAPTGQETDKCDPPHQALITPLSAWTSKADQALNRINSVLETIYRAELDSFSMISEGDVVASSAVYLNNPVHIALELAQGPGYTHRSEDTRDGTTRVDKSYYRNGVTYAVLDYKKPGYISKRGFLAGVPRSAAQYHSNISMSRGGARRSPWNEGTSMLLKQAVHYSYKFRTPFVALFDWNTLILLAFFKREERMGGDYCYMTVVDQSTQFRKAFLGFLLAADEYRNSGSQGSSAVKAELQPEVGLDFAANANENIEPKTHNTRGNRANYLDLFESGSPSGSQNIEAGSYPTRDGSNLRGRSRGDSRKHEQYYPPLTGRGRTGANDPYVRGRSSEPGKERARSKTRDVQGYRMDEPRSRSQYSADRVKMGRTQTSYGGIVASGGSQATYYQQGNPASATGYKYASGRDDTYQLDGKTVLRGRGRTDKGNKDRQKGGKLSWFSR